jgi:hypothetical protein
MSEGRLRSRIVGGALLAVAGALMFVAPSAVLRAHGAPRWLALAVGLVAFPALPVGWHAFAEWRRRRRATQETAAKKPGLTLWDRFVLRLVVVGVVAIGGTWAIARGDTWSALRHHALWFTSWTDPDPIADSPVLARVPAAAEGIVWIRPGHTEDLMPVALAGELELAIAFDGKDQLIVARGRDELLDQLEQLSALGVDGKRLARVDAPAGMRILATPGWREATGAPPAGLVELLRRAPAAANAIAVARPVTLGYPGVRSAVAWAEVRDTGVVFEADVEATDVMAAGRVVGLARKARASEDCGNRAFRDAVDTSLVLDGMRVRGTATLPLEAARDIPRCMTMRGF